MRIRGKGSSQTSNPGFGGRVNRPEGLLLHPMGEEAYQQRSSDFRTGVQLGKAVATVPLVWSWLTWAETLVAV